MTRASANAATKHVVKATSVSICTDQHFPKCVVLEHEAISLNLPVPFE